MGITEPASPLPRDAGSRDEKSPNIWFYMGWRRLLPIWRGFLLDSTYGFTYDAVVHE